MFSRLLIYFLRKPAVAKVIREIARNHLRLKFSKVYQSL